MKNLFTQKIVVAFTVLFFSIVSATNIQAQNMFRKMNDFDGDGKTDFAVTRSEGDSKIWYIWQSRDGFKAFQWGIYNDINTAGDYDGDGKTDIAIFRPVNFPPLIHTFWIWNSGSSSFTKTEFADVIPANAPMHQDYNGDGKTDPAVWIGTFIHPQGAITNVYVKYSDTNGGSLQFQIPVRQVPYRVGDMTGDGRSDNVHSFYDPQSNSIGVNISDIATGATRFVPFGISGDRVIPGDFDGDGIGDLAIWRSSDGNWWWIKSSDNTVRVANWGISGDTPVPGDYDGDGITDLAVWRPGSDQSYYWVYGSQNGISVVPWGISTDRVVEP
ncbi:hypothetical protein BH20ACI4_BH20ACI4_20190 [soil metagenome]